MKFLVFLLVIFALPLRALAFTFKVIVFWFAMVNTLLLGIPSLLLFEISWEAVVVSIAITFLPLLLWDEAVFSHLWRGKQLPIEFPRKESKS